MSVTEALFGSQDKEDVGSFDQNEADDLKLHVRQCARRYRALDYKLTIVVRLILAMIGLHILTMIPIQDWPAIAKIFIQS